jgi:hypothetical protein
VDSVKKEQHQCEYPHVWRKHMKEPQRCLYRGRIEVNGQWFCGNHSPETLERQAAERERAHWDRVQAELAELTLLRYGQIYKKNRKLYDEALAMYEALKEALVHLEYLDEKYPTGTTPPVLGRLHAILAHIEEGKV